MGALITRRRLLLAGMAVGVATCAASLARLGAPAPGYRVLAPREVEIIEAIARVLFPPGVFPVAGGDGGTAARVDQVLAETIDPAGVAPFRYLLRAIEIGTLFSRGVPFADLPPDEAKAVLDVWASEDPLPRRIASDTFKVVLGMAFFRRPEVMARIGWRAGCPVPPRTTQNR